MGHRAGSSCLLRSRRPGFHLESEGGVYPWQRWPQPSCTHTLTSRAVVYQGSESRSSKCRYGGNPSSVWWTVGDDGWWSRRDRRDVAFLPRYEHPVGCFLGSLVWGDNNETMSPGDRFVDPEPVLREQLDKELKALDEWSHGARTRVERRRIRCARRRVRREYRQGRWSANWIAEVRTRPEDQ